MDIMYFGTVSMYVILSAQNHWHASLLRTPLQHSSSYIDESHQYH